jgi:3-isopropylmalate/(R)-2-methylmalate dehydratase large subunit
MEVQRKIANDKGFKVHTASSPGNLTDGICHTLSVEQSLVKPGDIGIGTDSHTCSLGVLNALAWGVGATHFANTLVTNEALVEVPKSVKINLNGRLNSNATPKDLMLYILSQGFVKDGSSTNTVFEYDGEGLDNMTLGEQFVLTNMAVEGRAMTGIITRLTPALVDHLIKTTGLSEAEISEKFVTSDPKADYYKKMDINLEEVEPMVALPGDPRNGIPLSKLRKVAVANVYIGSCTGGNLEDLENVANELKGKKVANGIKVRIQAASISILNKARDLGYLDIFSEAGAEVVGLGCGACIGLGPGRVENVTNEDKSQQVTVSDTNRNFPGRMGGNAPVYLTSPITAAAAAVNGFVGDKS